MNPAPLKKWLVCLALIVFALHNAARAQPNQEKKDPLSDRVDRVFAQWDKPDSPACALAVIKDGQITYKRGYGLANLEHNIPMSPASIMDTGSVSKQFTAMAVALLAEQGKVSLDDDIRKYLPEIPQYQAPITIRHLIHHTSGIRDYLTLMGIAGMRDDDHYVDGEVIKLLARQKELNFKPGSEFLYSNSGYFLLSQIVKRASGKTLREFADENIFKPLGMTRTRFYDDHTEIVKNRAASYMPRRAGGFQIAATTLDMVGDGNVLHAVTMQFPDQKFSVILQCNLGTMNPSNLARRVADIYLADQFKTDITRVVASDTKFVELAEQELRDRTGAFQNPNTGVVLKLYAKEGKLFADVPGRTIRFGAISAAEFRSIGTPLELVLRFEKHGQATVLRMQRGTDKPITLDAVHLVTPAPAQLAEYGGEYRSDEVGATYMIVLENGKLFLRHENEYKDYPRNPLEPTVIDTFFIQGLNLRFERDARKQVAAFTLNAGRVKNIRFVKKPV